MNFVCTAAEDSGTFFLMSVMLQLEDDDDFYVMMFMLLNYCILSCEFLQQLDNLLLEVTPDQVVPHLAPVNRYLTFDLFHPQWCYKNTRFRVVQLRELYHLLEFPAMLVASVRGNVASSE